MHLHCTALVAGLAALTVSMPVGLPTIPGLGMPKRGLSDDAAPAPKVTRPDFYTIAGCNSGDTAACSPVIPTEAPPTDKRTEGPGLNPIIEVIVDYKREEPKLGQRGFKATPVERPAPNKRVPGSTRPTWAGPLHID